MNSWAFSLKWVKRFKGKWSICWGKQELARTCRGKTLTVLKLAPISLRSWRDSWAGEWRWSRHIPRGQSPQGSSRAAKPRVTFPPATFRMGFACRPLLSLLMNQLNKPIRERSVPRNLRFISARNGANARDSSEINPWFTWRSPITRRNVLSHLCTSYASNFRRTEYFRNTGNWWDKGLACTKPNNGLNNTQHNQQPCVWRATFESCGTKTIKVGINLYIALQKHKLHQVAARNIRISLDKRIAFLK